MLNRLLVAVLGVAVAGQLAEPVAAKSYRYESETGETVYSDALPPSASGKQHRVIDPRGMTVERVKAARSDEEIAREKELVRLRKEQEAAIARQQERDSKLLQAYSSEDDILRSRKGKLDVVKVTEERIKYGILQHREKLVANVDKAASYERRGQLVPPALVEDIKRAEQAIAGLQRRLKQLDVDRADIIAKSKVDLQRFRELQALAKEQPRRGDMRKAAADNPVPVAQNMLAACHSPGHCERMWTHAKAFVLANATYGLQTYSDTVMVTSPPVAEHDISMVVSRLGSGYPAHLFLDIRCVNNRRGRELCAGARANDLRAKFNRIMAQVKE